MKKTPWVITIDGSSGVGKGTVSVRLATHFGWHLLDSGAIYRALAGAALRENIRMDDVQNLVKLADIVNIKFQASCSDNQPVDILLNEEILTSWLRSEEVGQNASILAQHKLVRSALLNKQRDFCRLPGLIADGRDMGTVVFNKAPLKIFLQASAEVRAKRRYKQLKSGDIDVTLSKILVEIEQRDKRDRERSVSPLIPANDAHVIDTSDMTVDAVYERILLLANDVMGL